MIRVGSMFSGSAMLDTAVCRTLGGSPAWFVENDPAASKVLAHHFPDVPNLGDVTSVDWTHVEPVEVFTAGFPCTDVSSAGRRAGLRPDTRSGLWSHAAYAISQLRPKLVIIENVRGLLSADAACDLEPCPWCVGDDEGRPLRALGCVLGDLANLGYVGRWHGLRASDVGAPHERFRVFICAWPASADSAGVGRGAAWWDDGLRPAGLVESASPDTLGGGAGRQSGRGLGGRTGPPVVGDGAPAATDTAGERRDEGRPEPARKLRGSDAALGGDEPASNISGNRYPDESGCGDAEELSFRSFPGSGVGDRAGRAPEGVHDLGGDAQVVAWGPYEAAIRRWELILGRPTPAPTVTGKRGGQQLSGAFCEWLMGWPQGWVTHVPGLTRNEMLRICGNGVVPAQAEAALRSLLSVARERAA